MAQEMLNDSLPAIFLSASVPDPRRNPRYFSSTDVIAIREAVIGLVSVVLPRALLVFGGHPAISPLVLTTAQQLGLEARVVIYQSRFFEHLIPPSSLGFQHFHWTEKVNDDRALSLEHMRREMLGRWPFQAGIFISGIFIGGMEGVEEELELFQTLHPGVLAYPIASTGGAALELFKQGKGPQAADIREALMGELAYGALFERLLFPPAR